MLKKTRGRSLSAPAQSGPKVSPMTVMSEAHRKPVPALLARDPRLAGLSVNQCQRFHLDKADRCH